MVRPQEEGGGGGRTNSKEQSPSGQRNFLGKFKKSPLFKTPECSLLFSQQQVIDPN
jgi:hypothetical protein